MGRGEDRARDRRGLPTAGIAVEQPAGPYRAIRPPQAGHSKPFGQRDAITTARHFSSVPYSASNPASLRGVGARIGWISSKFKNLRQIVLFEIQGFFKDLAYPCTNAAGVLPQSPPARRLWHYSGCRIRGLAETNSM